MTLGMVKSFVIWENPQLRFLIKYKNKVQRPPKTINP